MRTLKISALTSLLLSGAVFGFFYAWVCSTMWGLDTLPPETAIAAMQAMNASVRNAVFFPAFFLTTPALLLTTLLAWRAERLQAALWFLGAALAYGFGGFALTASINVPMNEALALVSPQSAEQAASVWQIYSTEWQFWNTVRTVNSGISLLLCGLGILSLENVKPPSKQPDPV